MVVQKYDSSNTLLDKVLLDKISEISNEWFFAYDIETKNIQYYGKIAEARNHCRSVPLSLRDDLTNNYVHKDDQEDYLKLVANIEKGIYEQYDIRYKQLDGTYRYFRYIYQNIYNEKNELTHIVGKSLDVHEQKILERRSKIDLLTGCYNKITAEHIIAEILVKQKKAPHALFIVDIDNFKGINDNLGHFAGDQALRDVSASLKKAFRGTDIIARIGGDEFIVFVENTSDIKTLEQKAQTIAKAFNKKYSDDNTDYYISGSIGIALYPQAGKNYVDLYKASDRALYQAKLLGKNQYVFYSPELQDGTIKNLTKLENADRMASSFFDYDLISEAFAILYQRDGDITSINSVLRFIAQKYNADRCYIFETTDNGKTYDNTFEWVQEGITREIDNLQGLDKSDLDIFFDKAKNGVLYSNDLRDTLTVESSFELMVAQGIKSFAHAYVYKENVTTFFLGLDDCTDKRIWSEKSLNSLQYIAKIISIMRQSKFLQAEIEKMDSYSKMSSHIADNSSDVIYVSDTDTYDLIYLNKTALKALGNPSEDAWKGKKCYSLLQGKSSPCEFCTNHLLNDKEFYEWTYFNPILKRHYFLQDKLIPVKGKLARLEIATDITQIKSLETELTEKLEEEELLLECVKLLQAQTPADITIENVLELFVQYHDAERGYLFEINRDSNTISNTVEWCIEGVKAQKNDLQKLPISYFEEWFDDYEKDGVVVIKSVARIPKNSIKYAILKDNNIKSLITAGIKDSDGNVVGFIGVDEPKKHKDNLTHLPVLGKFVSTFLSERYRIENLNRLSYYDTLTGAKNRHSYSEELANIDKEDITSLGIIYVDVRCLDSYNDMYGYTYGDTILIEIATLLSEFYSSNIFRVGGDEFIVLCKNMEEIEFEKKAQLVQDAIASLNEIDIFMGYTWNDAIDITIDKDTFARGQRYRKILAKNLENEIQRGKFVVYLQPQINLQTGNISGAEALIRKKNADSSIQPPVTFLPFYEREGYISMIDFFVLETLCKQLRKWNKLELAKHMKFSINFSRMTLSETDVVTRITNICNQYSINPSQLLIEITESIDGISDEKLYAILKELKEHGFGLSLDDFGSGFSNLAVLSLFDFDELKIDKSLTENIHKDKKAKALTEATLHICKNLGDLSSLAEGIEEKEQFDLLRESNCHKGQGYYFDKPMHIEDFSKKYIVV